MSDKSKTAENVNSVTKTPPIPRAERELAHESALRNWKISEKQRLAASGEYVQHGCSFFKKQDIDELKEMGLRLAQDGEKNAEVLYMENVDGNLRDVLVCMDKVQREKAPLARPATAANDGRTLQPAPVVLAALDTAGSQAQNPARATTSPRQTAAAPVIRPV